MATAMIMLATVLLSTAVASAIFYKIGYLKGRKNARHHYLCGVHMDDVCDCGLNSMEGLPNETG